MKTRFALTSLLAFLVLDPIALAGPAGPQAAAKNPPPVTPAPEVDLWNFRFAPYAWVAAIDGDLSIGRLSTPVDVSLSDSLESLDIAAMGFLEASYGRWSFGIDTVYAKNSKDVRAGGILFRSFRFELKQWLFTPVIGYRVIETDDYRMDIFAGARITSLEAELTGRFVGGGEDTLTRDTDWVDPIIGIRGQAELTDRWFFRYNGDIGGFGASSDLIWQAFAGFGYRINEHVSVGAGYRGIGIDYTKGAFSMDTVSHGPVLGFEIAW